MPDAAITGRRGLIFHGRAGATFPVKHRSATRAQMTSPFDGLNHFAVSFNGKGWNKTSAGSCKPRPTFPCKKWS
jgi:hypothetical protein